MAMTLTREDVRAVAAEVARLIRPMLGVERTRNEGQEERISAASRAEISAQADRDITALLLKRSRKKR